MPRKNPRRAQTAPSSPASSKKKKKKNRKKKDQLPTSLSSASDLDTDDAISLCSELWIDSGSTGSTNYLTLENEKEEMYETLFEITHSTEKKLGSSRIIHLSQEIYDKLCHRYHNEFVDTYLNDLKNIISLLRSNSSSSPLYISLACKLMCIITVTISNDDILESFVNHFCISLLCDIIRDCNSTISAQVIAIDTLSFVCYFGGNIDGNESTIELLCHIWQSQHIDDDIHPKVMNAAIRGWTFLMSKLPNDLVFEFVNENIEILLNKLQNINEFIQNRISIGECICLYCDAWWSHTDDIEIDNIRRIFENVSNENTRKKRKENRELKSKFKQFIKSLPRKKKSDILVDDCDDEMKRDEIHHDRVSSWRPQIKLRFRSECFEFDGWKRFIEYHRIKEMLGSGTQTHLFENPRVQCVFDLDDLMNEMMENGNERNKERKKKVFVENERRNQDDRKRERKDKFERMNRFDENSIW